MYYTYHTDRLSLNILDDKNALKVLRFYTHNKDFEHYEPLRPDRFYTLEYQKLSLEYDYNQALEGSQFRYWIFEEGNLNDVVGTVSIRNILRAPYSRCEIGYKIAQKYRRRGYARESLTFIRDLIFDVLQIHRIEATVLPDNVASQVLLESIGFVREGYLNKYIEVEGEYKDHILYAAIKE